MKEASTSYIGLDIHKDTVAIAVAEAGRTAPRFLGTINPSAAELCKTLRRNGCTPKSCLLVYEAGPCGYGWARYLLKQGWNCEVIAPSRITRQAAEKRLKTDRRDALLLARESRAGNLTAIVVPDARDEAIRDLSRAREDAVAARLKARQQLKAMLLRHGRVYHGKSSWTQAHERHLSTIHFEHPAQQIAFDEYRQSIKDAHERVERLAQGLREQCESWRMKPVVQALMCLRGVDFLAAVTLVAELGDLTRFAHPCSLMAYLGLVPSEFSSGNSRASSPALPDSVGVTWARAKGATAICAATAAATRVRLRRMTDIRLLCRMTFISKGCARGQGGRALSSARSWREVVSVGRHR